MTTESLRLFVVEDDDDIALLVRKSLERAGHHVTRCRTGADALSHAEAAAKTAPSNGEALNP